MRNPLKMKTTKRKTISYVGMSMKKHERTTEGALDVARVVAGAVTSKEPEEDIVCGVQCAVWASQFLCKAKTGKETITHILEVEVSREWFTTYQVEKRERVLKKKISRIYGEFGEKMEFRKKI
jgi:hypothetical protein